VLIGKAGGALIQSESNNGAQKLIDRILDDARAEAEVIAKQSQAEAQAIRERAKRDEAEIFNEAAARIERMRKEVLERHRTNAELDSRKYMLAKKRDIIEKAYTSALEQLHKISGKKREEFLQKLTINEADGGERIIPSKNDAEEFAHILPQINKALEAAGKTKLELGSEATSLSGGFLLIGEGYEKDCSFDALLRDVRNKTESEVALILFE